MFRWAVFVVAAAGLWGQSQRIEVTVEQRIGSGWKAVNPGHVFSDGDQVRFKVKTNFPGHLYVMNMGTSGTYTMLYPREDTGLENRVEAGKELTVPAGPQGSFRITGPAGQDVVYWVVSPVQLPGPALIKQAPAPTPAYVPLPPPPPRTERVPETMTPRCDDAYLRARGECVDGGSGVKAVGGPENLPKHMRVENMTSRELFYMREETKAVVSSPTPMKGPAVFEFRLAHK